MQTKIQSLLESVVNIFIGFIIAVLSQIMIFPLFDIHTTTAENIEIAIYFTFVGLVRSYLLRRMFNYLHRR